MFRERGRERWRERGRWGKAGGGKEEKREREREREREGGGQGNINNVLFLPQCFQKRGEFRGDKFRYGNSKNT